MSRQQERFLQATGNLHARHCRMAALLLVLVLVRNDNVWGWTTMPSALSLSVVCKGAMRNGASLSPTARVCGMSRPSYCSHGYENDHLSTRRQRENRQLLLRQKRTGSSCCKRSFRLCGTAASDDNSPSSSEKEEPESYHWTSQTFALGFPALIGMMADPVLSLMDTAYVGRLGSIPLAALGTCTSIFHLVFHAFRATTTATTSLVASAWASSSSEETDNEEVQTIVTTTAQLAVAVGTVLTLLLLSVNGPILRAMSIAPSSPLRDPARSYLQWRCIAAPAVLFITVAEGAFRGVGNTRLPLLASAVASVLNAVLDPLFMFVFHWGVGGAAGATALSQMAAAGVYFGLLRAKRLWKGSPKTTTTLQQEQQHQQQLRRWEIIWRVLGANLAMMAKQGSLLLAWTFAASCATRMGPDHVAAHQITLSLWLVMALLADGTSVASQVLMSRCFFQLGEEEKGQSEGKLAPMFPAGHKSHVTTNNLEQSATAAAQSREGAAQTAAPTSNRRAVRSLTWFMLRFAFLQATLNYTLIRAGGRSVALSFSTDRTIRRHLVSLIPYMARHQFLVSITLIVEALAAGAKQFTLLGVGTMVSTLNAIRVISRCTSVQDLWEWGLPSLFGGRLVGASLGVLQVWTGWKAPWQRRQRRGGTSGGVSGGDDHNSKKEGEENRPWNDKALVVTN